MDNERQPTIASEAELPENWIPIDVKPIIPGQQPANSGSSTAPLVGSLPPSYQQNTDFSGVNRASGHVPQLSLMPLGIQGNPATNAAIISTAVKSVPASTPAPSQTVSIQLNMPPQYTVTGSPADANGDFIVTWNPEPSNFFLAGPVPSLGLYVDAFVDASTSSGAISLTATPVQSSQDFALLFTVLDGLVGDPAFHPGGSFSSVFSSGTISADSQQLSSLSPVTAAGSLPHSQSWTSLLALFSSNGSASLLNNSILNSGNFGSGSSATPAVTAASTLILCRYSDVLGSGIQTITNVTDTQGNNWYLLASLGNVSGSGTALSIWVAPNAIGGANTVTWTASGNSSGDMVYFEFGGLTGLPGTVTFRAITGPDLPFPSTISKGAVFATTPVASQFLTGLGTNGRFSQAQPAFTDLTGNIAVAQMNNGTGASGRTFFRGDGTWDTISEFTVDSFTNGGNIGLTNVGAPGVTGLYRISVHVIVNSVASVSSTLPDCLISWTDGNNNAAQSIDFVSATPSTNTLTTWYMGTAIVYVDHLTSAVQYQIGSVLPYASAGGTNMTYNVHIRMEAL